MATTATHHPSFALNTWARPALEPTLGQEREEQVRQYSEADFWERLRILSFSGVSGRNQITAL